MKAKSFAVPSSALSPDGYIINQGLLRSVSFDRYTAADCGCGWISAYNLLHFLTGTRDMETICRDVEKYVVLRGRLGVNFLGLWWYLHHRRGCRFRLTLTRWGTDRVCRRRKAPCGIMLYFHRHGAHYITFVPGSDHSLRYLNLVYGRACDERPLKDVFRAHVLLPLTPTLIYLGPTRRAS